VTAGKRAARLYADYAGWIVFLLRARSVCLRTGSAENCAGRILLGWRPVRSSRLSRAQRRLRPSRRKHARPHFIGVPRWRLEEGHRCSAIYRSEIICGGIFFRSPKAVGIVMPDGRGQRIDGFRVSVGKENARRFSLRKPDHLSGAMSYEKRRLAPVELKSVPAYPDDGHRSAIIKIRKGGRATGRLGRVFYSL